MVNYEDAKKIYENNMSGIVICSVIELSDAFVISGAPEGVNSITGGGLTLEIDKETGRIKEFILPNKTNFDRLEHGTILV